MKILFIAPGDSLHTTRWIERVKARGIDCIYYDMTGENMMHPMGLSSIFRLEADSLASNTEALLRKFGPIGKILGSILLTFAHYREIRSIVAREKPDLIHLHWLFHASALATSFIKGVPIISTPWGSDLLTPEYKVTPKQLDKFKHKYVVGRVIKHSEAFCCDAQHMKELLISFGAKSSAIQIIYFGTDVNLFSPAKKNPAFWEKFGLKREPVKIISNRVLADMYDIETFIRASVIVHDSISNVDFLIAGGGPKSDALKEYANIYGTKKGITFTGRLNDEEFAIATSSCDIYVSTSPTDGGIAASVAEAMSASVPVVITDFGDNAYWLKNQTAGFIFQIGDEKGLADQLIKLVENESMRIQMGEKGRDVILKENNSIIEVDKIIKLYSLVSQTK
jgi:glycosyltransferase involved in cell wall biosynthesis